MWEGIKINLFVLLECAYLRHSRFFISTKWLKFFEHFMWSKSIFFGKYFYWFFCWGIKIYFQSSNKYFIKEIYLKNCCKAFESFSYWFDQLFNKFDLSLFVRKFCCFAIALSSTFSSYIFNNLQWLLTRDMERKRVRKI